VRKEVSRDKRQSRPGVATGTLIHGLAKLLEIVPPDTLILDADESTTPAT